MTAGNDLRNRLKDGAPQSGRFVPVSYTLNGVSYSRLVPTDQVSTFISHLRSRGSQDIQEG